MQQGIQVLLLAVAALVCLLPSAKACTVTGVTVGDIINDLNTPKIKPDGSYGRYSKEQVQAHFVGQPAFTMRSNSGTTFSCVDARSDGQLFGTPGGDFAEMVAATIAWFKLENKPENKGDIATIFDAFMTHVASPSRPIFFHTDDSRLRQLFQLMEAAGVTPKPSILPDLAPENAALWLDNLVKPEVQGCGHIRFMLNTTTSKFYSVQLSGATVTSCADVTNAADCIKSAEVAAEMLRLFYNYWWPTPAGSPERAKVKYSVDLGPLVGKAVAIVTPTTTTGGCANLSPLAKPNFGGSTLFVYHDQAVRAFRASAARLTQLVPAAKQARFIKLWNDVASIQLTSTLTYLSPANDVGIFPVSVETCA